MLLRNKKVLSSAAIVGVGATIAIFAGTSANADIKTNSVENVKSFVQEADANYDLAVLDSPNSNRMVLPENLRLENLGGDGIRPETLRLVATGQQSQTYVGLNQSNLLCMVVYIPGDEWSAGSSCTTPESFGKSGLGLRVLNPQTIHETYIVPDSAAEDTNSYAKSSGFEAPSSNVIVLDPELSSSEREENLNVSKEFSLQLISSSVADEMQINAK